MHFSVLLRLFLFFTSLVYVLFLCLFYFFTSLASDDSDTIALDTVALDTVALDTVALDTVALDTVALDITGEPLALVCYYWYMSPFYLFFTLLYFILVYHDTFRNTSS